MPSKALYRTALPPPPPPPLLRLLLLGRCFTLVTGFTRTSNPLFQERTRQLLQLHNDVSRVAIDNHHNKDCSATPLPTTTTTKRSYAGILSSTILSATTVGESSSVREESVPSYSISPLGLPLSDLTQLLGGKGRAKLVWKLLRQGDDPLTATDEPATEAAAAPAAAEETPHQNHGGDWKENTSLGPQALERYRHAFGSLGLAASVGSVVETAVARDGTTKLVVQFAADGLRVETVILPFDDRQRSTLCVSSQVGCRQGCTFCRTGRMGKLRSLSVDEILVQVWHAVGTVRRKQQQLLQQQDATISNNSNPPLFPIDNIVFMGMGEPGDNTEAVMQAAERLTDADQFALAPRRVTISTVAPHPETFALLGQAPAVLAWSVHASRDAVRRTLVPTTRYTMVELREGLIHTLRNRSRRMRAVMLEVALLDGINDDPEGDAVHLADFCQPLLDRVPHVKLVVNLIPWNDIGAASGPAATYRASPPTRIAAFQQRLVQRGVLCYVRTTRGDDESAACGQLATPRVPAKQQQQP